MEIPSMKWFSDALYWLSNGLLLPTLLGLAWLFARALWLAGETYQRRLVRRRHAAGLRAGGVGANAQAVIEAAESLRPSMLPVAASLATLVEHRGSPARRNRILAEYEVAADLDLAPARTLTRLGPLLGLMGTLIPLGPALLGLASGDVKSLVQNVQVAFATTVVGLVAGAIGFLVTQSRQRWQAEDLMLLEFASDLFDEPPGAQP
ncbi:MAG: MotA/TolQ/ExbB proton channel family protein [Planctomycetota bacterium]